MLKSLLWSECLIPNPIVKPFVDLFVPPCTCTLPCTYVPKKSPFFSLLRTSHSVKCIHLTNRLIGLIGSSKPKLYKTNTSGWFCAFRGSYNCTVATEEDVALFYFFIFSRKQWKNKEKKVGRGNTWRWSCCRFKRLSVWCLPVLGLPIQLFARAHSPPPKWRQ